MDDHRLEDLRPFAGVGRVYVDAMNVIGTRPDGWWRDRDGALRRLVSRLQALAATTDAEVVVVADGRTVDGLPEGSNGGVVVCYASRDGRDAADDRIVELIAEVAPGRSGPSGAPPGEATVVVTADRELRERAAALGAGSVGPRVLLAALDHAAP